MRPTSWRVRVRRAVETYVEVTAVTAEKAEEEASKVPQVLSVFAKSAMRLEEGDPEPSQRAGVES